MKIFNPITYLLFSILVVISFGCKKDKQDPVSPEIDTTMPMVRITSPVESQGTLFRNVEIEVQATANGEKTISKVEFYLNGVLLSDGIDSSEPFSYSWVCTERFGETQQISVTAYDSEDITASDTMQVVIWNGIEKTPMPTERYAFETCEVNGKIYVIGGYSNNMDAFKVLEEYDPATDTWTTKTSSNYGHAAAASCVIDNIIYIFGGDKGLDWTPVVEAYNPATDTWTQKDSIPQSFNVGIGMQTCSTLNGKAYLFGGVANPQPARSAVYDPITNSWDTLGYKGIFNATSVTLNNRIYLMGGCPVQSFGSCDDPSNSLEVYDEINDSWIIFPDNPQPHTGHAMCVVNGKIYTMGGAPSGPGIANTHMEVYEPGNSTWTVLTSMPSGEINFNCAAVNGKIYIIGRKVYEYTIE